MDEVREAGQQGDIRGRGARLLRRIAGGKQVEVVADLRGFRVPRFAGVSASLPGLPVFPAMPCNRTHVSFAFR